jgi:hypothetical protein
MDEVDDVRGSAIKPNPETSPGKRNEKSKSKSRVKVDSGTSWLYTQRLELDQKVPAMVRGKYLFIHPDLDGLVREGLQRAGGATKV